MLKSIDRRLEALHKAGFKVGKNRELKSGAQYKVLTPKGISKAVAGHRRLERY